MRLPAARPLHAVLQQLCFVSGSLGGFPVIAASVFIYCRRALPPVRRVAVQFVFPCYLVGAGTWTPTSCRAHCPVGSHS